jgi:hypothetical protein
VTGDRLAPVVTGRIIPARDPADGYRPAAVDERPLSLGARRLVVSGIPAKTLSTYENAWNPFTAWCEANGLSARPAAQSTMIEYINHWVPLPVHNRCTSGRQANGDPCGGHRPAPSSLWVWYAAVRFYHSMPEPPFPWHGGKRLALAMKGYCEDMVNVYGWEPNKAPRAYPEHIVAMIDALDLDDPLHIRDRSVILTNWFTAARASDLATYRLSDALFNPRGVVELTLRDSKTNKSTGRRVEPRALHPNLEHPAYCPVEALRAYVELLRRLGANQGALYRPWTKIGPNGAPPRLLRGHRDDPAYRMDGSTLSLIIERAAVRAGIPDGQYFTCHSLRRGRASFLHELGLDVADIARPHGWSPHGAVLEYIEEAEAGSPRSPFAMGLLG